MKKNSCEKQGTKKIETFGNWQSFSSEENEKFSFFCLQRKTFLLPTIYEFVKLFLLLGIFLFLKMMNKMVREKRERKSFLCFNLIVRNCH